jgi:hypothetical protein
MQNSQEPANRAPSLFKVFTSVVASMFGVQSSKKHAQDFTHGKPWAYIVVGLIMTVVFVLTLWLAVKMVLKSAGV